MHHHLINGSESGNQRAACPPPARLELKRRSTQLSLLLSHSSSGLELDVCLHRRNGEKLLFLTGSAHLFALRAPSDHLGHAITQSCSNNWNDGHAYLAVDLTAAEYARIDRWLTESTEQLLRRVPE